jgi:hypothetical protein
MAGYNIVVCDVNAVLMLESKNCPVTKLVLPERVLIKEGLKRRDLRRGRTDVL